MTMMDEERAMESCIRATVEALHSSPFQAVLYLAGGASQIVGWLISVPGSSNTVLEVVVPYSKMSMIQLLSKIPSSNCSQQTAEDMALLAYNRALKLSKPGSPVVGVGFTGALATTYPLREHRFYMSTRTANRLWVSKVTLTKGLRTRKEEDRVSSHLLLKAIANACKLTTASIAELNESDVTDEYEKQFNEDEELEQLINGQICFKIYSFSSDKPAKRKIILPGSFNPLHEGHLKLLEVASSICGDGYPCFEMAAVSMAGKPVLSVSEIKDRVKQFEGVGKTVIISNQPLFIKRAELFPGSAFVMGADTAVRIINPRYYDGDYSKMLKLLTDCKETGCTFLVGGRNIDGAFKVVDDLDIPEELKDMFISIPAEKFRMDISSTEIRKKSGM